MRTDTLSFRCIAYQEKDGTFTGVCLDLDIVEEEHPTLNEAILSINDAIASHMEAAKKQGFPKELLNRPAPKEYWEKLSQISKAEAQKLPFENFQFFTTKSSIPSLTYA